MKKPKLVLAKMIKSAAEIAKMRIACKLAAQTLDMITDFVKPGVSTGTLDKITRKYIVEELDAIPSTLNHQGFPASICASLNHVVCHGIPDDNKFLKKGDILNIDVTVKKDGYIGDTSRMFILGEAKPYVQRLVNVAKECMYAGISAVKPGNFTGDIGCAVEKHAIANGYSVVREYGGHGIGKNMWEKPHVASYGKIGTGVKLEAGMIFTIEPMVNMGKAAIRHLNDRWTVVTKDRKLSAQWEHTILVTETGSEILTL